MSTSSSGVASGTAPHVGAFTPDKAEGFMGKFKKLGMPRKMWLAKQFPVPQGTKTVGEAKPMEQGVHSNLYARSARMLGSRTYVVYKDRPKRYKPWSRK
ncbi:MAG: hypothetical protein MN733_22205 [Nitrososphaera sp.]|nr:hypothetical protein [Nitrososphaera sp.]